MSSSAASLVRSGSSIGSGDADLTTESTSATVLYDDDGDFEDVSAGAGGLPSPQRTQLEARSKEERGDEQQECGNPPPLSSGASGEYDDDAFEGENEDTLHDEHESYSDDGFEDPDTVDQDPDLCAPYASYGDDRFETESGDTASSSPNDAKRADERESPPQETLNLVGEQEPEVESAQQSSLEDPLVRKWCSSKIEALTARLSRPPSLPMPSSQQLLSQDAVQGLLTQLQRTSKSERGATNTLGRLRAALPTLPRESTRSMLANAKAKRLLHTSFDRMVTSIDSDLAMPTRTKHLSTFCDVKRASLEGKLATSRFENAWARSCTQDASAPQQMSIRTLQFIEELVAAQRLVFAAAGDADTLFSCMKTCAPTLDRTVEATEQCLRESQRLRTQAARVLLRRQTPSQATTATH